MDCLGTLSLRPAAMSGKSLLLKVILLGDGGVGKSSLMNRYVTNKFDSQAFHTIGVEFLNRDLEVDGRFVTLQIWDTAGQERFKSLRTPFYRGADCCLLTFSVDDRQSFENLSNWQKEFIYYADVKDPEHFPFVVLGNKIDKLERQVSTEEARAWCMENGNYPYLETSAKDDTNVTVAFEEAVRQVLAVEEQLEHCMLGHTIDLNSSSKSGSSWAQGQNRLKPPCAGLPCWLLRELSAEGSVDFVMSWGEDGPLDSKGVFPKESNELLLCATDAVGDPSVFGEEEG
ncbi:hypothetical protein IHE44_0003088 [Lamprotornis superbus]|uniref:small monomeric GTPase n=1 Tax=Lamprotornis superbus TaxID=245042 RepID=A0A835TXB0_9PASS|nr:hypothetical protein IHE44_0003088 [Lamprotornis superbus]